MKPMDNLIILGGADFRFVLFNHLRDFTVWIDKEFPHYVSLNYAVCGTVHYQCGEEAPQVFTQPVLWWTEPGLRFRYGNQEPSGWEHYYVCFAGARVREWRRSGLLPSTRERGWRFPQDPETVRDKMARMIACLGEARPDRALPLLQDLLLDLHEPEGTGEVMPRVRALRSLADRVRARPADQFDEAKEAKAMGLSPVHFRRLFAEQTGLPPHRFLMQARLAQAELLLRTTELPLKVVAQRCGFYDEYHFSRLFRRALQVPPALYRKRARLVV